MIGRMCKSRGVALLLTAGVALTLGASPQKPAEVLIIQDELPQMKVLADFLKAKGNLSVTIRDQSSLPQDLSAYRAVLLFVHRDLQETTEKAIIDYTHKGGRLICLHHSISRAKAANKFYFDFLGVRLDQAPMTAGGYAYKASAWTLVSLNPRHYITSFQVNWTDDDGVHPLRLSERGRDLSEHSPRVTTRRSSSTTNSPTAARRPSSAAWSTTTRRRIAPTCRIAAPGSSRRAREPSSTSCRATPLRTIRRTAFLK